MIWSDCDKPLEISSLFSEIPNDAQLPNFDFTIRVNHAHRGRSGLEEQRLRRYHNAAVISLEL